MEAAVNPANVSHLLQGIARRMGCDQSTALARSLALTEILLDHLGDEPGSIIVNGVSGQLELQVVEDQLEA